jgi:carboxymethylenebutenolidase
VEIHEYDAGHAFNREDDVAFQPEAARLAWSRTLDFLSRHLEAAR